MIVESNEEDEESDDEDDEDDEIDSDDISSSILEQPRDSDEANFAEEIAGLEEDEDYEEEQSVSNALIQEHPPLTDGELHYHTAP